MRLHHLKTKPIPCSLALIGLVFLLLFYHFTDSQAGDTVKSITDGKNSNRNKESADMPHHLNWVTLLGKSCVLWSRLSNVNPITVEQKWLKNGHYHFQDQSGGGYLCVKFVLPPNGKTIASYDLIPWTAFSLDIPAGKPGGKEDMAVIPPASLMNEFMATTPYAIIFRRLLPPLSTMEERQAVAAVEDAFKSAIHYEFLTRRLDENLTLPDNVRPIDAQAYPCLVDIQVALPGTQLPAESEWKKRYPNRMLRLRLVPDIGPIRTRYIPSSESNRPDTSDIVEQKIQILIDQALEAAISAPAERTRIVQQTKLGIMDLFQGKKGQFDQRAAPYIQRLKRWMHLETHPPKTSINPETEFLYEYMAGIYHVLGKRMDGNETYLGRIRLTNRKRYLEVDRYIDNRYTKGKGRIESAIHGEATVLRVRFDKDGMAYEATYQWHSDLDNYPRFTGVVVRPDIPTDVPGLEALFIDHSGSWDPME